jgi:hypothetical protein
MRTSDAKLPVKCYAAAKKPGLTPLPLMRRVTRQILTDALLVPRPSRSSIDP